MEKKAIKKLIEKIGFVPLNGASNIFAKKYSQHNDYNISIDFKNEKIVYILDNAYENEGIKIWNNATSNFAKPENFVVLECIDRLLEKGYPPSCIELEKSYPLGRKYKGNLDVLVKSSDGNPYILFECKTWGTEFEKEQILMNRTGGQLFSYYANERAAKYLCLYTSTLGDNEILYNSYIIPVEEDWTSLSGTKEIVSIWNGNFKHNGIFESDKNPYNIRHTALTYGELQTITAEHSDKIFDLIMEILRHNVVSDKPNAFNKLLNLFVCKIIDEDKQPENVVDFQVLDDDTKYSLQTRLNDLYKQGMWRFLNIRVTDYSESEIEELTSVVDDVKKKELKEVITKLRLQKNPEFAFIEVCDDKTFEANNKILKEIVELLQGFKFRYSQKHQFLGDFFELLLSTSIKQESGQFFTPPPITRFILSAMPLEQRVEDCVKSGDNDFLPTVIDFACGSGHFLTEYMERMQNIIDTVDFSKAKPSIKKAVRQYKDDGKFSWADEYVYGIDLDYRLVKTTKVSAFFNGDGEAQIVWANGLGRFSKTPEYLGKLRNTSKIDKRDNASFDILISNPPYSVEAFKSTLDCGEETFELFNSLSDKSKEIECLFVERMKQLLKPGGWAGIILPVSLLIKDGINNKTREILFKFFEFKAIVEMGSNTFMKTSTPTVVLFLKRRNNIDWQNVSRSVEKFFNDCQDVTVLNIEEPFTKYANNISKKPLDEYIAFAKIIPEKLIVEAKLNISEAEKIILKAKADIIKTKTEAAKIKIRKSIIEAENKITEAKTTIVGEEKKITIEKDKLLYFILTYSQIVVLIKSGQKQVEKEFLGYKNTDRRGREGRKYSSAGNKLFDEKNLLNPEKVSSYIYNNFLDNKPLKINPAVEKHVSYERLNSLINYETSIWSKQLWLVKKSGESPIYKFKTEKIKNLLVPINGDTTKITEESIRLNGKIPVVTQRREVLISGYCDNTKPITDLPIILMGDHNCSFKWINFPFIRGADGTQLLKFDNVKIEPKYAFYFLSSSDIVNEGKYERHFKYVKEFQIPIPSIQIQKSIIVECETVDKKKIPLIDSIERYQSQIEKLFERAQNKANKSFFLGDKKYFNPSIGKRVLKDEIRSTGKYPVLSANVNEPFGFSDKLFIEDFSVPSVLWGIDGDWMTAYMPENKPFYPTDHCGVLRVLNDGIHPRYLTWLLEKEGQIQEFSRSQRASIDRIKSLNVTIPSKTIQHKTVEKVFELEYKIESVKIDLLKLDNKYKEILDKYL